MNFRPFFIASVLCLAAPATSRAALGRALQTRILQTAAQLDANNPENHASAPLALSLAQAGDASGAARLATTQPARDAIAQWRAQQRSMRGDSRGAMQAASLIGSDMTRADAFLVVTRLSLQNRDNATARVALDKAMRALDKSSSAGQISYAAWLHWRLGDVNAAKRVFIDKAWPAAIREDEADRQMRGLKRGETGPFSRKYTVAQFAARSGLLAPLLQRVDPDSTLPLRQILNAAQTAGDLNFLFERAMGQKDVDANSLYTLAVNMAHFGYDTKARELRARAQKSQPTSNTIEKQTSDTISLALLLAHQLNDAETVAQITRDWPQRSSNKDVSLIVQALRIFDFSNLEGYSQFHLRADATPAAINDFTAQFIKFYPSNFNSQLLSPLIPYYARHDKGKLHEISQFVTRQIATEIAQSKAKNEEFLGWAFSNVEIAVQLQRAGYEAEALNIVNALIKDTPDNFRPYQATELMKAGFAQAARQTFDPLQRLKRDQILQTKINAATDPKLREQLQSQRIYFDWGDYAENEARFGAPDAPARWFDAIQTPQQRTEVLKGWTQGLWPQLKLEKPYFKATIFPEGGVGSSTNY